MKLFTLDHQKWDGVINLNYVSFARRAGTVLMHNDSVVLIECVIVMRCIISGFILIAHVYGELLEVHDLKLCSIFNPLEECRSCNGSHVLYQLFSISHPESYVLLP